MTPLVFPSWMLQVSAIVLSLIGISALVLVLVEIIGLLIKRTVVSWEMTQTFLAVARQRKLKHAAHEAWKAWIKE